MSAITISERTSNRNISSRMFPCRVISPVVRPSIPHALSAGAISFCSTSLKSIPSLAPKGRTMNARVTLISRLRSYRLKLVNSNILKGSHDIERGWKMLRLYLLLRGNLSNAREFIHVRGIVHFCDFCEFVGRLFDLHLGLHPAWLQKHVVARICGELRTALAIALHGQHGTIDLPWRNAVCQPLQHAVIQPRTIVHQRLQRAHTLLRRQHPSELFRRECLLVCSGAQ